MKMIKSLVLGSAAGIARHGRGTGGRSSRKGQSGRIREGLLAVWRRLLLYPGHRHLHQARRLSCASTPRSTAASTISRPGAAISASATVIADYFATRSRLALTVDTRTATEYGVVRTFGQGDFSSTPQATSTANPNALNTNLANNPNLLNTPGGGYLRLNICSSSSPASPSVSRPPPMRRPGMAIRATTRRS